MSTVLYGQVLALLASMCGAFSSVAYNRIGQKVNSDILAFVRMCIAVPIMLVWAFIADGNIFSSVPVKDLLLLFASGYIGFFITDMYLFRAYAIYGANETMVVMCLAPLISSVLSVFLFDEILTKSQYMAVCLSVFGVIAVSSNQLKERKKFFSYGLICALIAALFQVAADLLAKTALTDIPHRTSAAVRAVGGLVGWAGFAVFKFKGKIKSNEELHKFSFMLMFTFIVLIGTIVGTTFAVGSLKYAPAGIATSLKQISPIFILPYDFFILKKRSGRLIVGTLFTVAGVILFFI